MKTKTALRKNKISRVWIEHKTDENPDTSWLGEFTEEICGTYVDRKTGELRDAADKVLADGLGKTWGRGELSFITGFQHSGMASWNHVTDKGVAEAFINCRYRMSGKGRKRGNLFAEYGVKGWQTAVTRNEKIACLNAVYCCDDASRLEDIGRGAIGFIGVIAKCEVVTVNGTIQTLRSGGLWGIESDSGKDYLDSVAKNELQALRSELEAFGFSERQIDYAFRNVETH